MVPVWVEVLKKVYPALARLYNAVVGGSQVFLPDLLPALILITPVEKLLPSARRLAAGVKHLVSTADCSSLPQRLAAPCEIAKRRLDFIKVEGEEVPEVEALGVDRVIYAFCKATGTIVV